MKKLRAARVAVFGLGGVGGACLEALARGGIGALDLIDHDEVSLSNLNRQLLATRETIGRAKCEVAAERIRSIDPEIKVTLHEKMYLPETAAEFDFTLYDYIIDAIDTVTGKLALIKAAKAADTPIISSMGTGNKLDASRFRISDISETSICPLARTMRKELKKRGIEHVKVLWSDEEPLQGGEAPPDSSRRATPGSVSFVPPVAGFLMAGEVIRDLIR